MYLVKESIDGCGKHTDVICLHQQMGVFHFFREETAALERVFAEYAYKVEPIHLRSLLSAPAPTGAGSLAACRRKLKNIVDAVTARNLAKKKKAKPKK
jgi:hypothetical protein